MLLVMAGEKLRVSQPQTGDPDLLPDGCGTWGSSFALSRFWCSDSLSDMVHGMTRNQART